MTNIKYIGKGNDNGKVHVKVSSHETGSGAKIDDNPEDWEDTNEDVTCRKNGCCGQ